MAFVGVSSLVKSAPSSAGESNTKPTQPKRPKVSLESSQLLSNFHLAIEGNEQTGNIPSSKRAHKAPRTRQGKP